MGMFDSLYIQLKCPNCGDEGEKECQTKDLECGLNNYHVGESIGTRQFRWLDVSIRCHSETCQKWQEARDGYRSGFGYGWDGWAEIDEQGRITGRVQTERPDAAPPADEPVSDMDYGNNMDIRLAPPATVPQDEPKAIAEWQTYVDMGRGFSVGPTVPAAPPADGVVVPREPTEEMVRAAYADQPNAVNVGFAQAYRAMLAAAPKGDE